MPRFSCSMTRTDGQCSRTYAAVPSVEPSSTTTTSSSAASSCASTGGSTTSIRSRRLYVGIATVSQGIGSARIVSPRMRAALGRNVLANLINVAASIGASLISLPVILDRIGTAGYGVWTIALTFIVYLAGAEAGFGPAAQRWASVLHGGGEEAGIRRVLWTSLTVYALIGVVVVAVMGAAAPGIVHLFDFPVRFRDDAVVMFRIVGVVMALILVGTALANVLQGTQRFAAAALTSALGSAVYLAAVIAFLHGAHPLIVLALAAAAQQVVTVLGRALALWRRFVAGTPI